VALADHGAEQLVGERLEVEAVVLHRRAEAADREVELAALQQVEQLVARFRRGCAPRAAGASSSGRRQRAPPTSGAAPMMPPTTSWPKPPRRFGLEVGDEALEVDQRRAGELDDVAA
jgi:hypothetical protein